MGERQPVRTLVSGPRGGWAVVLNDAGHGVLLNTALPASPVPSWVPAIAEAIAGRRIPPSGAMEQLPVETYLKLAAELANLEGDDYWHAFLLKNLLPPPRWQALKPPITPN